MHKNNNDTKQLMDEEYSRGLSGCLWTILIIIVACIAGSIWLFT